MKNLLFLIVLFANSLAGQNIAACKQRFDRYLNFRSSLSGTVKFEPEAIYLVSGGKKVLAVYENEIPVLSAYFQKSNLKSQEELVRNKGLKHFSAKQLDSLSKLISVRKLQYMAAEAQSLKGFKIAIDPGHFATNLTEAKLEQKYLYFAGTEGKDSVKLFESALTYNTAEILKKMLEEKGAEVMLTRDNANHTSFNCTFTDWIKTHKQRTLDSLFHNGSMSLQKHRLLSKANNYNLFWDFFRDYDLGNRSQKINAFAPDITLIIHYNVDEKNVPWTKHSNKNFTMAFIGGAFTADNLERSEGRVNFLRLLLSDQLNRSQILAGETVSGFKKNLDIEIAQAKDADYLKNNCLTTASPGVFCRNLALCRKINSPLVYGESLYQDNIEESYRLMKTDFDLYGLKISSRLHQVANAYLEGLLAFLKTDKNYIN